MEEEKEERHEERGEEREEEREKGEERGRGRRGVRISFCLVILSCNCECKE